MIEGIGRGPASTTPAVAPTGATPQLAEAAREFESLLLNMMIKAMRDSVPRSDLFGDHEKLETYEMMRDQELSRAMSDSGGVGFADLIVRQFEGREQEGLQTLGNMGRQLRAASQSYQTYGDAGAVWPDAASDGSR